MDHATGRALLARVPRDARQGGSFLELCKTPELAAEVTLQPIDRLGVDAAILFSDILVPLEPMGMAVGFPERGRGSSRFARRAHRSRCALDRRRGPGS